MTHAPTLTGSAVQEDSDAELISRVRGNDLDAYGVLFARHRDAALRLARQLLPGPDADDLVSEAFTKVMNVLLGGGGPDVSFRPYLLTAVRRLHVDRIRATKRAMPTDDLTPYDGGEPFNDTVVSGFEGGAAAKAFASLPERWQLVLWHLEVEGAKPADVAPLLGMSANSVSALAYRAREGLRQAFLQMHTGDIVDDECEWTHGKLGAYVRNGLSRRDAGKVDAHLDGCRKCTAIYLELTEVNSELAGILGPLLLGTAAAGYLTTGVTTAGTTGGILGLFGWLKETVAANTGPTIAVGATVAVGVVAATAFAVAGGDGSPAPAAAPRPPATTPADPPPQDFTPTPPAAEPTKAPASRAARSTSTTTVADTTQLHAPAPRPSAAPAPASSPRPTPAAPPPTSAPPATPPATPPTTPPTTPPPTTLVGVTATFTHHGQSDNYATAIDVHLLGTIVPIRLKFTLGEGDWGQVPQECTVDGATLSCPGTLTLIEASVQHVPGGTPIRVALDLPGTLDVPLPGLVIS